MWDNGAWPRVELAGEPELSRAPGPAQAARARTKPRDSSGIPGLGAETAGFEPARGYAPLPP